MKFVFALALVAMCVILMHARPNVKRDAVRIQKRGSGNGKNDERQGPREDPNAKEEAYLKKAEQSEEKAESEHDIEKRGSGDDNNDQQPGQRKDPNAQKEAGLKQGEQNLENAEAEHNIEKRASTNVKYKKWPTTTICYKYDKSIGNKEATLRKLVQEAAAELKAKTGIILVEKPDGKDCILFKTGTGCWSYVGKQSAGLDNVVLGADCYHIAIILHEVMHSLGLVHQQQTADSEKYINILSPNIDPSKRAQFQGNPDNKAIVPPYAIKSTDLDYQYDACSIMGYPADAFSNNGNPTSELKNRDDLSSCLGNHWGLSIVDAISLAQLYGTLDGEKDCKFGGYRLKNTAECECNDLLEGDTCDTLKGDEVCKTGKITELTTKGQLVVITTPGYDECKDYPTSIDCAWGAFISQTNKELKMCMLYVGGVYKVEDAATNGKCAFDYFQIFTDPQETKSTKRSCSTHDVTKGVEIESTINNEPSKFFVIRLHSDDEYAAGGFKVIIKAIGIDEHCEDLKPDDFKGEKPKCASGSDESAYEEYSVGSSYEEYSVGSSLWFP